MKTVIFARIPGATKLMDKKKAQQVRIQTRQEAEVWLEMSRCIARAVGACMENRHLDRNDVAEKLGVSVQYVGRLLSGTANLSLKSVARIETALDIRCFSMNGGERQQDNDKYRNNGHKY